MARLISPILLRRLLAARIRRESQENLRRNVYVNLIIESRKRQLGWEAIVWTLLGIFLGFGVTTIVLGWPSLRQSLDTIGDILRVWGNDWRIGLALAKAESGLRCEAYHFNHDGSIDHSVFQLNSVHKWRGNLSNCKENVRIAYEIFKEQGGTPWVVYQTKAYLKYL
jgi:hypothetical protein